MITLRNRNKGENEDNMEGTITKDRENKYMPETVLLWNQIVIISKVFQKQIKIVTSITGKKKSRLPGSQIKCPTHYDDFHAKKNT